MYIYIVYIYIYIIHFFGFYIQKKTYTCIRVCLKDSIPLLFLPWKMTMMETGCHMIWDAPHIGTHFWCAEMRLDFFLGPNLTMFKHFDGDPIQLMFLILEELNGSSKRGVHPKEAVRVDAMDFFRSVCSMSVDTFLLNFLGHMSMIFSSPSISIKVLVKSS